MKNLSKKLIIGLGILALPFVSAKAQHVEKYLEDLPFQEVPERFHHYQDRADLDTIAVDTIRGFFGGIPSQRIYLDINNNKVVDVVEWYALKPETDSTYKKSSAPWKYFLVGDAKGKQKGDTILFDVVFDYFMDKINGNEVYEEKLKEQKKERLEIEEFFLDQEKWLDLYDKKKTKEI
jgi:hypothetical protein